MPATDEQLMLAYAGGDAAAFEALYSRHKGPLFRFVLRSVKAHAQAEELFQRGFRLVGRIEPRIGASGLGSQPRVLSVLAWPSEDVMP